RIYYDGIPLEVYGNGLPVNTIPVDALERVDVYKGVMPIDVGTDALGGGLNLVPVQQSEDHLRTSYSFGSFNTHRFTFNGLKKLSERTSLSTISYLNYSDNDYRMRNIPNLIEIELPNGSPRFDEERIDTRRFHDQHISGFIEGKLRIKKLKWADRLDLAVSYSRIFDEIQNLGFVINTAIGEAEREIEVFAQRIDYRKTFFNDKLNVRYFGVLSQTVDKINDSTLNRYNWRGEILTNPTVRGGEIRIATLLDRENVGTTHRLTLAYKISDNIDVRVSDYYRYTRLQGEDPLGVRVTIDNELTDPNTLPSSLNRNILGAELNAHFFDKKLNAIAFFKNYFYQAEAVNTFRIIDGELDFIDVQKNSNGYGFALKYQLHPAVFIRTSVEQALRIPTERELLGDLASTLPNFDLQPEESLNWNLGAQFERRFQKDRFILVNVNGFIRNRENLIRPKQVSVSRIQFINEAAVDGKGIELALKVSPLKNLSLQGNFTSQSNQIASGLDLGDQVPNIPLTFFNVRVGYSIQDLLKPGNNLALSWTYLFTDKFSINTVPDLDTANPDAFVPEQHVHNAGLTYLLKSKGLALSFNLQNVFNAEVFDNFRIPRPGINYAFKINYSL
ncbi:MAG: TonB-dependent receptor, partial [Bacteroidota bacterium]